MSDDNLLQTMDPSISPLPEGMTDGEKAPFASALGKVAAPPNRESTSEHFYFWVERNRLVERTQIVYTTSQVGDRPVTFIGLVEEVYRQSRQHDIGEEVDRHDGLALINPPFPSEGFTYAKVVILRTDPVTHAPPVEESSVYLGGEREAAKGYGLDRMGKPLAVGLLRNGGTQFAGPAKIDLDFLLGKNGGHLNVNGIAGLGAKSSLLLHVNYLLLRLAAEEKRKFPGKRNRLQIVPIIFNVKNYDLFHIDRWSKEWSQKQADAIEQWSDIGIENPGPFQKVQFFAPQLKNASTPVVVGRPDAKVKPYSWALADIIDQRLFRYLFADDDVHDANFGALIGALEERITQDTTTGPRLRPDAPATFLDLLEWVKAVNNDEIGGPHSSTRAKLMRRLRGLLQDGEGVLRRDEQQGNPLRMPDAETDGPIVIDLNGIKGIPSLQRFVVAAVFQQLAEKRSGNIVEGLRYVITLDELNRFAPKSGRDPITEKIELVAGEMRSQGIILLGAQQQASLVSPRVIENCGIRALGRSGALELSAEVWKFLSPADRSNASQLVQDEKLLMQPSFRKPMLAKIPFPPWAMNQEDAGDNFDADLTDADQTVGQPPRKKNPVESEFA